MLRTRTDDLPCTGHSECPSRGRRTVGPGHEPARGLDLPGGSDRAPAPAHAGRHALACPTGSGKSWQQMKRGGTLDELEHGISDSWAMAPEPVQ